MSGALSGSAFNVHTAKLEALLTKEDAAPRERRGAIRSADRKSKSARAPNVQSASGFVCLVKSHKGMRLFVMSSSNMLCFLTFNLCGFEGKKFRAIICDKLNANRNGQESARKNLTSVRYYVVGEESWVLRRVKSPRISRLRPHMWGIWNRAGGTLPT
jgi:hypothetical protein